jgi:histone arginine demethylase JMJD6
LKGHKRWALFPPETPKSIVDPPMKPYDHEGVSWFSQVFPKFKVRDDPTDIRTLGERLGMIEVLQRPGEIIFVPGGWHHVVMNLGMNRWNE